MAGIVFNTTHEPIYKQLERLSFRGGGITIWGLGEESNLGITLSDQDDMFDSDFYTVCIDGYILDNTKFTGKSGYVANLYDTMGLDCFNAINGGWSAVIVDKRANKIIFARDRWGEVPLYYSTAPFAVATERKAFFDTSINPINTELLGTRHYMVYDLVTKTYEIVEYYKTPDYVSSGKDFPTVVKDVRALAEDSMDLLLNGSTDIAVAVGGVDSSAVTYMLTERGIKPELLVVSYGDSKFKRSDLYGARLLSKELSLPLHEIILTHDDLFTRSVMEEAVYSFEYSGWQNTSIAICFIAMARKAKEIGAKNVFTGMMIDILLGSMGPMEAWYYDPKKYIPKRQKDLDNIDNPPDGIGLNKTFWYGGNCLEKTPFINNEFVDYCLTIPIEYREVNGKNKAAFRYAFEGCLSNDIIFRPKISSVKGSNMFDSFKALGKDYYDSLYRGIFDHATN